MQQIGGGTTTLTGSNTYSGGTFFNNGTLAASADSNLGAATGGLTFNGGAFQYNSGFTLAPTRLITINAPGGMINTQSFNPTIDQGMIGAGELTKTGSGALILTGANSYTGGTTISAGTLQLGNGGTTGSIVGDVVDNGVLAFDRSDTVTFAGVISGSGAVAQIGPGDDDSDRRQQLFRRDDDRRRDFAARRWRRHRAASSAMSSTTARSPSTAATR